MRTQRDVMARFAVDEKGNSISPEQAFAFMDELTLKEMRELSLKFQRQMNDAVVPLESETGSS